MEDAFLETAKKIYQNIQDGSLDLNAAESGVQHKPSQSGAVRSVINTGQGGGPDIDIVSLFSCCLSQETARVKRIAAVDKEIRETRVIICLKMRGDY